MTSQLAYSVPGKTFLVGEYVALDGGPSIILTTSPRFVLRLAAVQKSARHLSEPRSVSQRVVGVHEESPAGKLLKSVVPTETPVGDFDFVFEDPHAGRGGLGASTAQFATTYAALRGAKSFADVDVPDLMATYRECAWSGEGTPPSGADLVAQLHGGVTYFDGNKLETRKLEWGFGDLGFSVIRTGSKLATHEHLKKAVAAPFKELRTVVSEVLKAFGTEDSMRLIEAVNAYSHILRHAGLTSQASLDLLGEVKSKPEIFWGSKGCGAMGADTILVLHDRARGNDVAVWAEAKGLQVCATEKDLSGGLKVET